MVSTSNQPNSTVVNGSHASDAVAIASSETTAPGWIQTSDGIKQVPIDAMREPVDGVKATDQSVPRYKPPSRKASIVSDAWKTVGNKHNRRASLTAVHNNIGYFTQGLASAGESGETLLANGVNALVLNGADVLPSPSSGWSNHRPDESVEGGMQRVRSFSVTKPPSSAVSPKQRNGGLASMSEEGPEPTSHDLPVLHVQLQQHQRQQQPWGSGHQSPMSDSGQRQTFLNRRVSAANSFNSNPFQASTGRTRRFSLTSGFQAPNVNSQQLANQYFNKDPALNERRKSIVTAALISPMAVGTAMGRFLPNGFAEQYGNYFDNLSPRTPTTTTMSSPFSATKLHFSSGTGSTSPVAATAKKLDKPLTQQLYYVVEFKGGRNDVFYLPVGSQMLVQEGDLVIVEADRGDDLGKVVMADIKDIAELKMENGDPVTLADKYQTPPETPQSADATEGRTHTKRVVPKTIYRHAHPNEVGLLVDKSRDEGKALSICQAKSRQKQLPIEVIDAEYQWDRKKLTFFFLAEQRVDFRELVKDLFKIYKTRIWMCAVERSGGSSRFVRNV